MSEKRFRVDASRHRSVRPREGRRRAARSGASRHRSVRPREGRRRAARSGASRLRRGRPCVTGVEDVAAPSRPGAKGASRNAAAVIPSRVARRKRCSSWSLRDGISVPTRRVQGAAGRYQWARLVVNPKAASLVRRWT
jgi:hypothetical protein